MFETITTEYTKTFAYITKFTTICIEDVQAIRIETNSSNGKYYIRFFINSNEFTSDDFDTEEEAIQFRNDIIGWNNDKQEL